MSIENDVTALADSLRANAKLVRADQALNLPMGASTYLPALLSGAERAAVLLEALLPSAIDAEKQKRTQAAQREHLARDAAYVQRLACPVHGKHVWTEVQEHGGRYIMRFSCPCGAWGYRSRSCPNADVRPYDPKGVNRESWAEEGERWRKQDEPASSTVGFGGLRGAAPDSFARLGDEDPARRRR